MQLRRLLTMRCCYCRPPAGYDGALPLAVPVVGSSAAIDAHCWLSLLSAERRVILRHKRPSRERPLMRLPLPNDVALRVAVQVRLLVETGRFSWTSLANLGLSSLYVFLYSIDLPAVARYSKAGYLRHVRPNAYCTSFFDFAGCCPLIREILAVLTG